MKRTSLVLTLLAVLALVAAACGGDSGGGGGGGEGAQGRDAEVDASLCPVDTLEAASADGPVQIEFWHAMTASNEETLNTMIDDYNASQDAVEVTGVFSGSYDETLDKYLTGLRSGELPQLVQLEETTLQTMIDSGSTVPAAACVAASDYDTSDILPSVLAEFEVEGTLWPMPFNVSNPVFYYDRNDFTAAGLDPDAPPATLDEMYDMGQTIVEAGVAEHAMSLEVQPWYPEQWMSMAGETLVDNTNGRDARAEAATVDNATMIDIFTWIREMVDNDLIFNVGRNPSGADHFF
ncbi:MAG: extracellular solute-binding protein, partial [Acidimicrobiales bacterium]